MNGMQVCLFQQTLTEFHTIFLSGPRPKPFWKKLFRIGDTASNTPEIPSLCKFFFHLKDV